LSKDLCSMREEPPVALAWPACCNLHPSPLFPIIIIIIITFKVSYG
jgi:hypothetical protein